MLNRELLSISGKPDFEYKNVWEASLTVGSYSSGNVVWQGLQRGTGGYGSLSPNIPCVYCIMRSLITDADTQQTSETRGIQIGTNYNCKGFALNGSVSVDGVQLIKDGFFYFLTGSFSNPADNASYANIAYKDVDKFPFFYVARHDFKNGGDYTVLACESVTWPNFFSNTLYTAAVNSISVGCYYGFCKNYIEPKSYATDEEMLANNSTPKAIEIGEYTDAFIPGATVPVLVETTDILVW